MSRVYIILVNWNGWQDTIECIESLLRLQHQDFRIVICDNGSQDESVARLLQWNNQMYGGSATDFQVLTPEVAERGGGSRPSPLMTLIPIGANLGFGGGCNIGLRYAQAQGDSEFCWLLNNDTIVEPAALTEMVDRLRGKPDASMCGSTLREYHDHSKVQALGGAVYFRWLGLAWHIGRTIRGDYLPDPALVEKKMDYVVGASLLVRSSYLKEVGLMSEDYFLYFEELDWVYRGRGRYNLAYAPKSVVYHKVGGSIGTATNPLKKNRTCDFYTLRNRLLFTRRYCPEALPWIYLWLFIELFVRLILGRLDLALTICRLLRHGERCTEA